MVHQKFVKTAVVICWLPFLSCTSFSWEGVQDFFTPDEEPPQITAIRAKFKEYSTWSVGNIYEYTPNVGRPFRAGRMTDQALTAGLNRTKFVRYLAGVSEDIEMDPALHNQAQHGAVLIAAHGRLSHTPPRPSGMDDSFYQMGYKSTTTSNIHHTIGARGTLIESVMSFMDDSDETNIDRVGHRRWILNPQLKKVAFGQADIGGEQPQTFITMQVFDTSGPSTTRDSFVAWPSPGYFPSQFFGPSQAWSISFSPENFDLSRSNPRLKLIRLGDNKEWVFSPSQRNARGQYFAVEKNGFGIPFCIIFRPEGGTDLLFNKKYRVEIQGMIDKSGNATPVNYEVEFFFLI